MKQNVLEDDIFWLESRTLDICLRNYLSAVSLTWIGTIPAMPTKKYFSADAYPYRVADVEGAWERRSAKGQGVLRKEGPPTYAILSQNLVLSPFTRF